MNNIRAWFTKHPPADLPWWAGYADGYTATPPAISINNPNWPKYARGYGEGRADGTADRIYSGFMGGRK